MRKFLPLLILLCGPMATQAAVLSATIPAADLAAYITAVEAGGGVVRFIMPAASRSWEDCPLYGCYEIFPGEPEVCVDPPEPPQPCPTFSEVITYTVISE